MHILCPGAERAGTGLPALSLPSAPAPTPMQGMKQRMQKLASSLGLPNAPQ